MKSKIYYHECLNNIEKILKESQKETAPYYVTVLDKRFVVYPNVFSPKYFNDTAIYAKNLPVRDGEKFLEIGSGTGVISIIAAYKGADKVVAIDINPDAVSNTKKNIELHNMVGRVEVRCGHLFSPLTNHETFDSIFWNVPFGYIDKRKYDLSILDIAVLDPSYENIRQFIMEGKAYLKLQGKLLIGFSPTLGKIDFLEKFSKEAEMSLTLIFQQTPRETFPVKYGIFQLKPM
jgi:release factor glutamine methyltransferase